jgi:electron transport complex protein RnfB
MNRREFLKTSVSLVGVAVVGGGVAHLVTRTGTCQVVGPCDTCGKSGECGDPKAVAWRGNARVGQPMLWQIDPYKCIQCGKCATKCVLTPSAVKCFHAFAVCGYCDLCTGFFEAQPNQLTTAAENQLCPTGAIKRKFVEDPYFQYTIDRDKCIGCSKCVKGCTQFGNGSLFLQIDQDVCVKCNQCSIAVDCPSHAISRVPVSTPYLLKSKARTS